MKKRWSDPLLRPKPCRRGRAERRGGDQDRAERRMGDEIKRARDAGTVGTPHRREKGSDAPTLSEIAVTRKTCTVPVQVLMRRRPNSLGLKGTNGVGSKIWPRSLARRLTLPLSGRLLQSGERPQ